MDVRDLSRSPGSGGRIGLAAAAVLVDVEGAADEGKARWGQASRSQRRQPGPIGTAVAGWTAHIVEQMEANSLIRPLGLYAGLDQRIVPRMEQAVTPDPA